MNFLAHVYLSGNDPQMLIGNFIADMVKGKQIDCYNPAVVEGILLHRKIDAYTDTHPMVQKSKDRLRPRYRLYAGVVVDMYFDHFLASLWADYSSIPLPEFAQEVYSLLESNIEMFPPMARRMLPYMVNNNWLEAYAEPEKLRRHFGGIARRTPYPSGVEDAVDDLLLHYEEFKREFQTFFPELISYTEGLGVSHRYRRAIRGA